MAAKKKSKAKQKTAKRSTTKKAAAKKTSPSPAEILDDALDSARTLANKPRRVEPVEAIFDAWNIVLGRTYKGARMVRLLKDFTKDERWEHSTLDEAIRLQPGSWNHVVRGIAAPLYEAAVFAEVQYARMRLVFKHPMRFGVVKTTGSVIGTKKQIAAQKKATAKALAAAKKTAAKAYAEAAKTVQADWTERTTGAGKIHKDIQRALSSLCTLEEERLRARVDRQVSDKVRTRCAAQLKEMARRRRSLARASAEETATAERLPNHLRKWNGARRRIVKTIDGV